MAEDVLPGTGTEDGAGDSDNTGLIAAGVAALEAGRRDEAESAFRKVLAREPDNPSALRRLGAVVYMKSDYEDARGLLDMAIDLAPEDADAYNNLAAILLDRGELTDAEINFRRARELDPADTDINFNLGLILLQRGNFVAARSCFEVVVAGRPDDADAHHNLGMAWRRGSGKDAAAAAIASFRRAVEIDGDDCDSLLELAALLREEGCLTEALAVLECVLKTENIDTRAHYNHGATLYDFRRYEDAVRSLRRAVAEDPPDLRAHDALGRALAAMGDMDGAIRAFRCGIEAQPDNHRIKRNLRDAYWRLVPSWHLPMINDSGRNDVYQAAIKKAVGADDIVLDIRTEAGSWR